MRDYGLSKATFFPGGLAKWQQLGNPVEAGPKPAPANLTFVRKLEAQDITIPDFIKALDNTNIVILDVRNDSERRQASSKGPYISPQTRLAHATRKFPKTSW
jgi:3-mercaptopyruvate sulfurtransferase SseA